MREQEKLKEAKLKTFTSITHEMRTPLTMIVAPLKQISPQEQLNITEEDTQKEPENEIITEIMAQIYIKQGKFQQAIEIIKRISANYPKKNRYFADQIRFLEKILANEKNKKQQ